MSSARLASIQRYPVKGFGAETLPSTRLLPGQGIPFDRCFAIANGERAVAPGEGWTPCQAFVRLTKNPELPGYALRFDEATAEATLMGQDGRSVTLVLGGEAALAGEDALAAWFAPGPLGSPRAVARSHAGKAGYWDHEDAAISIVNLNTVALLERSAGRPIDPLRFRANLYLADLPPLGELALVGRQLRIGGAVLDILRPTDRCRATSVDPATGDTGLNVPALLARTLGHVYCGVYARVVRAGHVAPGDPVEDLGPAPGAIRDGAAAVTAPPVPDWPRAAQVTERVAESARVVSFWLDDPLASLRPQVRAGQHLRVHLVDGEGRAAWRAYTISGVEGSRLRISVKREGAPGGGVSGLLHDTVSSGGRLLISGPYGEVHLRDGPGDTRPLVLLSAGIGLTPTLAMLRELVASGSERRVLIAHAARDETDLALWAEAHTLVGRLPRATARLHLSRANAAACAANGAVQGRMPLDAVLRELSGVAEAEAYACGPSGFLADALAALAQAGLPPERVHVEVFASPRAAEVPADRSEAKRSPRHEGPFRVRFASASVEATWTPQAGTLLDLAEAAGLAPPANCRSGACGACRTPLIAGSVDHLPEPVLPIPKNAVYLCCALPASDVVLA